MTKGRRWKLLIAFDEAKEEWRSDIEAERVTQVLIAQSRKKKFYKLKRDEGTLMLNLRIQSDCLADGNESLAQFLFIWCFWDYQSYIYFFSFPIASVYKRHAW